MRLRHAFVAIGVLAFGAGACGRRAEPPLPVMVWRACDAPEVPEHARCGTLTVFERRDAKAGRTIDLNVIVVPATGSVRAPDPVFWLEGAQAPPRRSR